MKMGRSCIENLNGLQKMREVIKLNHIDIDRTELGKQSIPLLKNPRLLAELADTNRKLIAPLWLQLIQEGIADGSIKTDYAKELSELLPLLTNFWLIPSVYPYQMYPIRAQYKRRSAFTQKSSEDFSPSPLVLAMMTLTNLRMSFSDRM